MREGKTDKNDKQSFEFMSLMPEKTLICARANVKTQRRRRGNELIAPTVYIVLHKKLLRARVILRIR